jgi:nitrogen fixation NifU-like protein
MENQAGEIDFARMLVELQKHIAEQERARYSVELIAEAQNPSNVGRMEGADAQAVVRGWCGDTMEFYLGMDGDRIAEITFMTDGCGPTVACGSKLTTMVRGMSLEDAGAVAPQDLIAALDGLPEENVHCADLAVLTLQEAIANHVHKTRREKD